MTNQHPMANVLPWESTGVGEMDIDTPGVDDTVMDRSETEDDN